MAAGLGFKTFTTGEVLTAADVNGYLMQGILVFANAAARDAAITSPQEGQCCYLKDTDAVLTYSGSAWVGFDDSNAIQNSIINAKGDLISGSANDTPAILSVGSNGETLVADSSTSTGLRWQPPVNSNPLLNSSFQIWQRGTSAALGGAGVVTSADRWATYTGGAGTMSRQVTGDTTNLPNIQYCARIQRDAGNTSTSQLQVGQSLETINSIPFAGKTVTLSFYARAGANYSAASSAFLAYVKTGTGTDQNLVSTGYTGSATPLSTTATLTTTWQRFTVTGTIATTATELGVEFRWTPVGTAGANDYAELTGVQLEVGSVATPFNTYAATLAGELAACQRYYFNLVNGNNLHIGVGSYEASTAAMCGVQFPVTMRTAPTLSATSGTDYYRAISSGGGSDNFNSFTIVNANTTGACIYNNSDISGTAGQACRFISTNASSFVSFVAEL